MWTTKEEIQYLNSIGSHTKNRGKPGFRLQCLRGYVAALGAFRRRWDSGVDAKAVEVHAKKLLRSAV